MNERVFEPFVVLALTLRVRESEVTFLRSKDDGVMTEVYLKHQKGPLLVTLNIDEVERRLLGVELSDNKEQRDFWQCDNCNYRTNTDPMGDNGCPQCKGEGTLQHGERRNAGANDAERPKPREGHLVLMPAGNRPELDWSEVRKAAERYLDIAEDAANEERSAWDAIGECDLDEHLAEAVLKALYGQAFFDYINELEGASEK